MLTCKQVTQFLSQAEDRPLGPGERLRLRLHLLVCEACSRFARQLQLLRKTVKQLGNPRA